MSNLALRKDPLRETIVSLRFLVVLRQQFVVEEQAGRKSADGQKSRRQQVDDDIRDEARRIQEREQKKGGDRMQVQQRMGEQIMAYIVQRLEQEVRDLPRSEME